LGCETKQGVPVHARSRSAVPVRGTPFLTPPEIA
jgi:hypothetical protein